jgi:hypothetical protein
MYHLGQNFKKGDSHKSRDGVRMLIIILWPMLSFALSRAMATPDAPQISESQYEDQRKELLALMSQLRSAGVQRELDLPRTERIWRHRQTPPGPVTHDCRIS